MKIRLFLFALLISLSSYAQQDYEKLKDEVHSQLELLHSFPSTLWNEDAKQFDPDSLSAQLGDDLTRFLNSDKGHLFCIQDFSEVLEEYYCSPNKDFNIQIIGFSYHSGGTAGTIYKPIAILNSKTKDQKAYDITFFESMIYDMHPLGNNTFLCISYTHGSSTCRAQRLAVIDFSDDSLSFRPVFNGADNFLVCNGDITFDAASQLLTIDVEHLPAYANGCDYYSETSSKSFDIECSNEEEGAMLRSKYDGKQFVKPF